MSRFNLLMVTNEPSAGQRALKTLSKVFRHNFVFEVSSMQEAESLLRRLQIDVLVLDLDFVQADFLQLTAYFPRLMVMGIAADIRAHEVAISPEYHRLFNKSEFRSGMVAELKELRKSLQHPEEMPAPAPALPRAEFRNVLQPVLSN